MEKAEFAPRIKRLKILCIASLTNSVKVDLTIYEDIHQVFSKLSTPEKMCILK